MNRRMFVVLFSLLVITSMLLAACPAPAATPAPAAEEPTMAPAAEEPTMAPAAEEPTMAPAAEEPTMAPAVEEPAGEVALRWRTRPDNAEEAAVYQSISDELAAQLEGISLTYEPGGSETSSYQDVLKTEIGAGTAPDVFWIPGTDVGDFAKRGLILNMADMAGATEGFSVDDFYAGPMKALPYSRKSRDRPGTISSCWR